MFVAICLERGCRFERIASFDSQLFETLSTVAVNLFNFAAEARAHNFSGNCYYRVWSLGEKMRWTKRRDRWRQLGKRA